MSSAQLKKTPLAFRCLVRRPGSVPTLYKGAPIGTIHIISIPQEISHRFLEFRNAATIAVHDDTQPLGVLPNRQIWIKCGMPISGCLYQKHKAVVVLFFDCLKAAQNGSSINLLTPHRLSPLRSECHIFQVVGKSYRHYCIINSSARRVQWTNLGCRQVERRRPCPVAASRCGPVMEIYGTSIRDVPPVRSCRQDGAVPGWLRYRSGDGQTMPRLEPLASS
jgi:hypothetical protein